MEPPSPSFPLLTTFGQIAFGQIATQLLIVLTLVLINAFFVASEFALVSVRRTRIDQLAAEGNRGAVLVQRALKNINSYIAAVQVGITVTGLLLGSIGERALEPVLRPLFAWLPQPFYGITSTTLAIVLAYFIMTTSAVVIGELVPKNLALQRAETMSILLVRPITLFMTVFSPVVWFLNGLGGFVLRLLGLRSDNESNTSVHSPEELDLLFSQSHEGGEITATEREILHRVVRFSDMTAREIMIPRVEMQGLKTEMPLGDLTALLRSQPHTRLPVMGESIDDILGIVHLKDLVRFEAEQTASSPDDSLRTVNLTPLLREAARVPETIAIDKMLLEFKRRRQQMAIVIDEYGGTSGLITMGDLLEQVFGDVHDEFDERTAEVEVLENGAVRLNGRVLISEINEKFHTGFSEDEADTVAGLVLNSLGRPAVVGDEVQINQIALRVEAIERLRITQVLMTLAMESSTRADDD